jgi:hypothetical protein
MGCDTGPGGDHYADTFHSTAPNLLNLEAQLAHDIEKKSAGGATPAW